MISTIIGFFICLAWGALIVDIVVRLNSWLRRVLYSIYASATNAANRAKETKPITVTALKAVGFSILLLTSLIALMLIFA